MERIPETECMDTREEARDYAAMDHTEANASFVAFLIEHGCSRGDLLDLGTGPGAIPMRLVELCPDVDVTATDISGEMLKIARLNVAHAGLSQRIRLMSADAKSLPFGDGHFDGVFSNTILHHVSDPGAFFREARRVLKTAGALVIRDLVRPTDLARVEALVAAHAATANDSQRKLFRDSLLAAYTLDEVRAMLADSGLADASMEMTSDRHLTIWIDPR